MTEYKKLVRHLFLIIATFNLVACGPSAKEKEEIAIMTCNIMSESRNMDAAFRLKEINSAREQMGEERFLLTDSEIKTSVANGLCKELVLNDPEYTNLLAAIGNAERKRAERERERERIREMRER